MYDQSKYASQYYGQDSPPRGPATAPHPPFPQGPSGHLSQFQQGLLVPHLSEILRGAPPHPPIRQVPLDPPPFPYQHGLLAPPALQPLHLPHQRAMSMGQPYSFIQPGPSYPLSMSKNNANYVGQGLQPMPPPPSAFLFQSFPLHQGSMYRIRCPPPCGVHHVHVHPPPSPPSFASIAPDIFMPFKNASLRNTHPPSLPPIPPPLSHPPFSPPPLLPSPNISVIAPKTPSADNRISSVIRDTSVDLVQSTNNTSLGGSRVEVDDTKAKVPMAIGEAREGLPFPPPKLVEEVVQNIEMLCQFIAKIGPDFENFARAKEVSNPQFSFLFEGEPRSAAAIAHEYFLWVKKKYCLEATKNNALPESPITVSSPKALNCENKEEDTPPAVSNIGG